MNLRLLRAHHRPTAFGLHAAHGCEGARIAIAEPVAMRYLVEAVAGRDGSEGYWLEQDVVTPVAHRLPPISPSHPRGHAMAPWPAPKVKRSFGISRFRRTEAAIAPARLPRKSRARRRRQCGPAFHIHISSRSACRPHSRRGRRLPADRGLHTTCADPPARSRRAPPSLRKVRRRSWVPRSVLRRCRSAGRTNDRSPTHWPHFSAVV